MRRYYLFKINNTFFELYHDNSLYLYKMLEQISKSSKNDLKISSTLFKQIVDTFDKVKLNMILNQKYQYDYGYYYTLDKHFYNDGVEKTKLIIHNTYIKIKTNNNLTCFFNELLKENNIFVCDFYNKDYFWLSKVMNKSCIK